MFNMMSRDQIETVKTVYTRFVESEEEIWTDLDSNLEMWNWLNNEELIEQAQIKSGIHSFGIFRCSKNHDQQHCLAPLILESVIAILALYSETKELHEKNRYILTYYLAMSEMSMIYLES